MFTQEDLCAIAKNDPEMIRAYYEAVHAIIDFRQELAKNQSGLWAGARLKKKQVDATFLAKRFSRGVVFNGQPISEDDRKRVELWLIDAANFHMMPKEEQRNVLMRDLDDARQAELPG
jgi:hypothetical protein